MLLVDHHHPERSELHPLLDEGVGTDKHVDAPGHQFGGNTPTFGGRGPIGQQVHLQGTVAQQRRRVRHGHPVQQLGHPEVVLFSQHLSGRHECPLVAAPDGGQQGGHRDHGLPGTNVALQEAMHGTRAR